MLSFFEPGAIDYQLVRRRIMTRFDAVTYFADIGVQNGRRYILGFNAELHKNQRKARKKTVEEFRDFVTGLNSSLKGAKEDRDRAATYKKFSDKITKLKINDYCKVKLHTTTAKFVDDYDEVHSVRTYWAEVIMEETAMKHSGRLDGYWMLVTNNIEKQQEKYQVQANEIIKAYRDKYIIEESFRDIKSFIEISPTYLWTVKHVKAHYTLCVLAHLINRTIDLRLHQNKDGISKEVISHAAMYEALESCMLNDFRVKSGDVAGQTVTQATPIQADIIRRLGMNHLLSTEFFNQIKD